MLLKGLKCDKMVIAAGFDAFGKYGWKSKCKKCMVN